MEGQSRAASVDIFTHKEPNQRCPEGGGSLLQAEEGEADACKQQQGRAREREQRREKRNTESNAWLLLMLGWWTGRTATRAGLPFQHRPGASA